MQAILLQLVRHNTQPNIGKVPEGNFPNLRRI